MKKIYYNKLIRDGIVDKIKNKGSKLETKKLSKKDFDRALFKKLEEEVGGVVCAKNKTELAQELADVLAVIEEIKKIKEITPAELKKAIKINFKNKGGFSKRLWLVWSSDDDYKTNEKKYKKR